MTARLPAGLAATAGASDLGHTVVVAAEVGRGRAVFGSFFYHLHKDPVSDTERQLVEGIFRWFYT